MKKLLVAVSVVLILSVLAWGCAPAAPAPAPAPAPEEVIHWKAQSTWIRGPGHQEWADYWTETLNNLCEGRLVIDKMYAGGEIIGAFEAIPACNEGKLDVVSGSGYYLSGTLPWISLILATAADYIDWADLRLLWQWEGGGNEIYQEYVNTVYDMQVFPCVILPAEPLYSIKPITKKEDFKGLKIRTTGLSMDFYDALGASAVTMPMGEVVPSLERKVIDACEFALPYCDYPAGIHQVCPYALTGVIHQPPCIAMEIWVNGDSWRALPDDLKQMVEYACQLTQFWFIRHIGYVNMVDLGKMVDEGLTVTVASPELQAWFYEVSDELAEKYAAEDPWAKKILDSQKAFKAEYDKYGGSNLRWFR